MDGTTILMIILGIGLAVGLFSKVVQAGTKTGLIKNEKLSQFADTIEYLGNDMVRSDILAKRLTDKLDVERIKRQLKSVDYEDDLRLKKALNEILKDNEVVRGAKLDNSQKEMLIQELANKLQKRF